MKTVIVNYLSCFVVVGVLSGCSTAANFKTDDVGVGRSISIPAENIEVYSTSQIGRKYHIIGQVVSSADAGTNANRSVAFLKQEAAKIGADAIINLKLAIDMGFWRNAIKSTGTAVAFEE